MGKARRFDPALVLGVILLGLGFAVLFQRMPMFGWLGWGLFQVSWPAVIIVAGTLRSSPPAAASCTETEHRGC